MRLLIALAALAAAPGCALQSAFDRLSEDVTQSIEQIGIDTQAFRAEQAHVNAALAEEVREIVEDKTAGLVTAEQAQAKFEAAQAVAKAEVERLEKERLDKLEREAEVMKYQAELRKRESAEEQKALIGELVSTGIGVALQSPATATAIKSVVETAYGGPPVSKDQVVDAIKEQAPGVSREEAAGYAGIAILLLNAYRSRTRKKDLEGAS